MKNKCVVLMGFNLQGEIKTISCGKWSCPMCAKKNARHWAIRAKKQIDGDNRRKYFMWTLTLGSEFKTVRAGYEALPKLWHNMRQKLERHYRKVTGDKKWKFTYLAFVEGQQKRGGMPHFHIITPVEAPYRIKDYAVANGFGYQATQKPVESAGATNYVSKYCSKGDVNMPKNFRRCRPSSDWADIDYEGEELMVQAKKEDLTHYFLRVSDETGVGIDYLWAQWKFFRKLNEVEIETA